MLSLRRPLPPVRRRDGARQIALGDGRGDFSHGRTCVVRLAASWLTFSVRPFQVPAAPAPWPGRRVAFDAHSARHRRLPGRRRWPVCRSCVMVSASAAIPLGFHGQLLLQVAVGHGGHDLAMPRTWLVSCGHSVERCRSNPSRCRTRLDVGLAASLPSVPTSRATRVTSAANELS